MKFLAVLLLVSCGKQSDIRNLYDKIEDNERSIDKLERQLSKLYNYSDVLSERIDDVDYHQDLLSVEISENYASIVSLEHVVHEQFNPIVDVIDVCGDAPNKFDEAIIKLYDGTYLAYFEQGGKRFLTELSDGNYITTDGTNCQFSIVNGELTY